MEGEAEGVGGREYEQTGGSGAHHVWFVGMHEFMQE